MKISRLGIRAVYLQHLHVIEREHLLKQLKQWIFRTSVLLWYMSV